MRASRRLPPARIRDRDFPMQRFWYLKEREFFTPGLEEQKERFLKNSTYRSYQKSDIIFFEGDSGDSCFYVLSGMVRIFSIVDSGKDPVFFLRRSGEMFGLAEVLNHVPRRANAQALAPTRLAIMDSTRFDRILAEDYRMARRVITMLGSRVRYLSDAISQFATGSVMTRLVNLLVALAYEQLTDEKNWHAPIELPVRISQELMASVTGSTQPTISDMMNRLQAEGLVVVRQRRITLLDPLALIARVEGMSGE